MLPSNNDKIMYLLSARAQALPLPSQIVSGSAFSLLADNQSSTLK